GIKVISGATSDELTVDTGKAAYARLRDPAGADLARKKGEALGNSQYGLPLGGQNDGLFRQLRLDRTGGMATSAYTALITYQLYTAALMPGWSTPTATFTVTHALASGTLLNAAATGAVSSHASLISLRSVP